MKVITTYAEFRDIGDDPYICRMVSAPMQEVRIDVDVPKPDAPDNKIYYINVAVTEMNNGSEFEVILHGRMKWDSCCDFNFADYIHICDPLSFVSLFKDLEEIRHHHLGTI